MTPSKADITACETDFRRQFLFLRVAQEVDFPLTEQSRARIRDAGFGRQALSAEEEAVIREWVRRNRPRWLIEWSHNPCR